MYKNLPMTWKVLSLLVILGIVSLGGAFYASSTMGDVDQAYSRLVNFEAKAQIRLARSNRFLMENLAGIYQTIGASTEELTAAAKKARGASMEGFKAAIADSIALSPLHAADFEGLSTAFMKALATECAEPIRIAETTTDAENMLRGLKLMVDVCEPALDKVTADSVALNARMEQEIQQHSAALSARSSSASHIMLIAISAGTIFLVGIGAVLVRRGIVQPIKGMMAVMTELGEGRLNDPVVGTDRKDEIGAMAQGLEVLRGQLQEGEAARAHEAKRQQEERHALDRRNGLAETFVNRMAELATTFAASSGQVAGSARNLSATAEQTSRQAQVVATAAEDAASNVQTVAASSEELAASVREITGQVSQSAQVADVAYREMEQSNQRINELVQSASAIGDVVSLIKGIADQTNLLALNATIESARAGEAGKGFAVVASEVKELASQTAKATEDISTRIGEIQKSTEVTVTSMASVMRVISDMKQISASIASAVEQQGAATGEIAHNCQRAATGTQGVTTNISGVGQAAQLTGSASTELLALSEGLSSQAADLRQVVETFVVDLKAA